MNIIIVDPIFRASRLQYSFMVAQKAYELGYKIHIITRTQSSSEQYLELFKNIPHSLYEVVNLPEDFWFGKIHQEGNYTIVDKINELVKTIDIKAVYFSGGHEIFPSIADILLLDKYKDLRNIPTIMIEYEPDFLLPQNFTISFKNFYRSIRHKLHLWKTFLSKKRKYVQLFTYFPKLYVGILDERFLDRKTHDHFFYLPDPSPNICKPTIKKTTTEKKITVLIVGLQTSRKGFQEIIKLLNRYEKDLMHVSFLFVGRLGDETKQFRSRIEKSPIIKWEEGYFSEDEICAFYESCDYVIMPYSLQFNGSSGVMAYATAFKKPMITIAHGCIGYRNKLYNMGFIYNYGDIASLYNILKTLPGTDSNIYQNMQKACEKFSQDHSVIKHQKAIFKKLELGNI